ncbi:MAG: DUF4339 domain-containing protein [Deltaproteobacteria bacterium]|nr:DUF4339 domain-containing protein [Deltaproteobacteria bacterium]
MASSWHYHLAGKACGPIERDDLLYEVENRRLSPWVPVWKEGMSQWQPMAQVEELAYHLKKRNIFVPPPPPKGLGDDAAVRMLLPVGRTGLAITAGYLGLLSLTLFLAPVALLVSLIAAWDLKRRPGSHGWGRVIFGLVMGVLFTVVLILVFLA